MFILLKIENKSLSMKVHETIAIDNNCKCRKVNQLWVPESDCTCHEQKRKWQKLQFVIFIQQLDPSNATTSLKRPTIQMRNRLPSYSINCSEAYIGNSWSPCSCVFQVISQGIQGTKSLLFGHIASHLDSPPVC